MNKEKIQDKLEKYACKRNGGMCESYEYCKFCKEPKEMYRKSMTPCADALLDMKDINKMLKNYLINKAKIATLYERIDAWNRALENDENVFIDIPESTLGMPKARNRMYSPVEDEAIKNEMNRRQALEMIKNAKSEKFALESEVKKIEIAFKALSDREMFIIECRYFDAMNWYEIEDAYNKKFNKIVTDKRLMNKIADIKNKILGIIRID